MMRTGQAFSPDVLGGLRSVSQAVWKVARHSVAVLLLSRVEEPPRRGGLPSGSVSQSDGVDESQARSPDVRRITRLNTSLTRAGADASGLRPPPSPACTRSTSGSRRP